MYIINEHDVDLSWFSHYLLTFSLIIASLQIIHSSSSRHISMFALPHFYLLYLIGLCHVRPRPPRQQTICISYSSYFMQIKYCRLQKMSIPDVTRHNDNDHE